MYISFKIIFDSYFKKLRVQSEAPTYLPIMTESLIQSNSKSFFLFVSLFSENRKVRNFLLIHEIF